MLFLGIVWLVVIDPSRVRFSELINKSCLQNRCFYVNGIPKGHRELFPVVFFFISLDVFTFVMVFSIL